MAVSNLFAACYEARTDERLAFGNRWCGPDVFGHFEEAKVATYEGRGDGQTVEVYCSAAPARFYRLAVLPGNNSVGAPKDGYEVTTGSGMAEFAAQLAEHISQGMIGFQ